MDLENLPVLVVDDNATNRIILCEILRHWHMKPTPVDSGQLAVTTMKQAAAAGTPFPLVLLDAMMPEMDGFTVAEQIKESPMLAGATILMLSSADSTGDARRCREVGIARYLRKPIKQSELLDAILIALGSVALQASEPATVAAGQPPHSPGAGWRVLLAEDNKVNQRLASKILEKHGHHVTIVENGREVLAALKREEFDMILMDVQMPLMDGLAATVAIRHDEQSTAGHIPIIALTAHAMMGDRERCLSAGMDAYVSKPLRPKDLFVIMENLLGKPVPVPASSGEQSVELGSAPVFDHDATMDRVEHDMELLREMVQAVHRPIGPNHGEDGRGHPATRWHATQTGRA